MHILKVTKLRYNLTCKKQRQTTRRDDTLKNRTAEVTYTALLAALVFVATYLIKIPNPATGGYSHMGDCMVFLAVVMIGRRNGSIAAAIGGALSDLLAGAAAWVLLTLVIKFAMAFIMGTIIYGDPMNRKKQLVGALVGGIFQIIAYTLVKIVLIGMGPAILSIPNVTIQTSVGIVLFAVLVNVLMKHAAMLFRKRGEMK